MLRIRVTPAVVELFRERRIFLRHPNDPTPPPVWLFCLEGCALESYSHIFQGAFLPLRLGAFSYSHSPLHPNLMVGRFSSIGSEVSWIGEAHPIDRVTTHPLTYEASLPGVAAFCEDLDVARRTAPFSPGQLIINVGSDVWIGQRASIMPGVKIGTGAVVAAGAVVTADVEPYSIVGGVPAKPIRKRFSEETIARLLKSEWWRRHPKDLLGMDLHDPAAFLARLEGLEPPLPIVSIRTLAVEEIQRASEA